MTNKTTPKPLSDNKPVRKFTKLSAKDGGNSKNILGPRLNDLRVSLKMTQQDVVALINERGHSFTTSTLSKIETQTRSIYDSELIDLLDIYSVTLSELLKTEESDKKKSKQ